MRSSNEIKEFIETVRPKYEGGCKKYSRHVNPNRLLLSQLLIEVGKHTDSEKHLIAMIATAKGLIAKEVNVSNNRWIPGFNYKVGSNFYTILKSGLKNQHGKKLSHFKLIHCLEETYNWLVQNPETCKTILANLRNFYEMELKNQYGSQPFPWNSNDEFLASILGVITSILQKEKETIEAKKREYPTPKVIKEKLPYVAKTYRTINKNNKWHDTLTYLMEFVHLTCDIHGEPNRELIDNEEEAKVFSMPYQLRLATFFYIMASIQNEKIGYMAMSPNSKLLNLCYEVFGINSIKEINPQDIFQFSACLLNDHLSEKKCNLALSKIHLQNDFLQEKLSQLKELKGQSNKKDEIVDLLNNIRQILKLENKLDIENEIERIEFILNERSKMISYLKINIGKIRTNIEDIICAYKDKQPNAATTAGRNAGNLTMFGATKAATKAGLYVAGRFMSGATAQRILSFTVQGAICVAIGVPFGGTIASAVATQVGKQIAPVLLPTAASLLFVYFIEPSGRHLGKTVENTVVGTWGSVQRAYKGTISFIMGTDDEIKVEIDPSLILTDEQKLELQEQAEFFQSVLRLPDSLPNSILTAHEKEMLRRRLDIAIIPSNDNSEMNNLTENDFVDLGRPQFN